jgi:hypothetical protein
MKAGGKQSCLHAGIILAGLLLKPEDEGNMFL